jgi:hypothetical protein
VNTYIKKGKVFFFVAKQRPILLFPFRNLAFFNPLSLKKPLISITSMDFEKPNLRSKTKSKHSYKTYARQIAQLTMPATLTVESHKSNTVSARGETFVTGVEYSLNKGRRWELQAEEFEPVLSKSSRSSEEIRVAVAHGSDSASRNAVSKHTIAFASKLENKHDTPIDDDSTTTTPKPTSRKDRRHHRRAKQSKPKTDAPNQFSEQVYASGSADILVAVTETPSLEQVKPERMHSEMRWREQTQARIHKNQDLARLNV